MNIRDYHQNFFWDTVIKSTEQVNQQCSARFRVWHFTYKSNSDIPVRRERQKLNIDIL